jgi:hypothetical protein
LTNDAEAADLSDDDDNSSLVGKQKSSYQSTAIGSNSVNGPFQT